MKEYNSPKFELIKYDSNEVLLESEVQETMGYESEQIDNLFN